MIPYDNMRPGRALINLVIITIIFLGFMAFSPFNGKKGGIAFGKSYFLRFAAKSEFLEGYIPDKDIDSKKLYVKTLVDNYDPEPSWKPGKVLGVWTQPETNGIAAMLVDINTGEILYEKDSDGRRPIASLAKIMTAVIALEHSELDEKIYVTIDADSVGENSMGITAGETYPLEDLLYGLVLYSGNDAAYAISEGVAGTSDRFVEWMNLKAGELGLKNTYFADPSGLDDSTYSTPEDLVKLTRYALKNKKFRKIVDTVEYETYSDDDHKYIYMYNQTNLLSTYPGVAGVKIGFTEEAGLCLVTFAENDGREVVGVVLNSFDRKGDMIMMLDHGFKTLGVDVEHNLL